MIKNRETRGRKPLSEDSKKRYSVTIRLTPFQWALLDRAAGKANLKLSTYIRESALAQFKDEIRDYK